MSPRLPLRLAAALLGMLVLAAAGPRAHASAPSFEPADCWFEEVLAWAHPGDYSCGFVSVPLYHDEPDGETIRLPVAVLPAYNEPTAPPLFVAQGGPGGDVFSAFADSVAVSGLSDDRDIVLFNQRGTLYAEPELTCPELWDHEDEIVALPSEEADAASLRYLGECHDRLEEEGVDLGAFNSVESAADIDDIRAALDYDSFDYYGVSYGTLLGLHLLRERPDHLHAAILDGVVPADVNFLAEVPRNAERVLGALITHCTDNRRCREAYPDLEDRLYAVIRHLDDEPATLRLRDPDDGVTVESPMNGDDLLDVLFTVAYFTDTEAYFPRLVEQLEQGDYRFLETLLPLLAFDDTDAEGAYLSVVCAEDVRGAADPAATKGVRPRLVEAFAGDYDSVRDSCDVWRVPPLPATADEPVASSVPVLLLSGHYDPITPATNADRAARTLSRAQTVTDPAGSHGVGFDSPCIEDVMRGFLAEPDEPVDTGCVAAEGSEYFVDRRAVVLPWLVEVAQLSSRFKAHAAACALLVALLLLVPLTWAAAALIRTGQHARVDATRGERWFRLGGRLLVLLFAGATLVFLGGLTAAVMASFGSPLSSFFAISGMARPILAVPLGLVVVLGGMLVVCLLSWLHRSWPMWERLAYMVACLAAAGLVVLFGVEGLVTSLL